MKNKVLLLGILCVAPSVESFTTPLQTRLSTPTQRSRSNLYVVDPTTVISPIISSPSLFLDSIASTSSNLLTFSDQGQNLAGIFFQASLLPYLSFLYFLSFRGNRTPELGNFGFQFLLLFVLSTIPSGIISKTAYETSLANVDWLHGGAELLLTITSLLVVFGFRSAMVTTDSSEETIAPKALAFSAAGAFAAACFLGPSVGFNAHSPFLLGIGNLPLELTQSLPWVSHTEPINALSIPTWAIHFSSVFEWIFAMGIIWDFAETTENPKWKGLTWGMLPLHASGIAACTYHFFYNNPDLQYVVSLQAFLTLLGNITCAIAAFRIAKSNGWTVEDLNPLPKSSVDVVGIQSDALMALPYKTVEATESNISLVSKLALATIGTSYIVKYGELALNAPFQANPILVNIVLILPVLFTTTAFGLRSQKEDGSFPNPLASLLQSEDGEGLSMEDVKKYGVAGTVAYVLTELAFWAVAFPVASTALYQSSGHWPDVFNDSADRATVLGFIFAGANIARLAVPLRLGAALAFAPWVDENIVSRMSKQD